MDEDAVVSAVVDAEVAGLVAAVGVGFEELVLDGDAGFGAAGVTVELSGVLAATGIRANMAARKRVLPRERLLSRKSRLRRRLGFQMPCIWNQELVRRVRETTSSRKQGPCQVFGETLLPPKRRGSQPPSTG